MKRLVLFISFIAFGLSLHAQSNLISDAKLSVISGNIKGFQNDTVFLNMMDVSDTGITKDDTIIAENGKFELKLKHNEALICTIYTSNSFVKRQNGRMYLPETRFAKVFLMPGAKIEISGILDEISLDYNAIGDELNKTYSIRRSQSLKAQVELNDFMLRIDSMQYSGVDEKIIDKLNEELSTKQKESMKTDHEYIKANPDKDLSAYYVSRLPLEKVRSYMEFLNEDVRNSVFGKMFDALNEKYIKYQEILKAQKKVVEGKQAPDFALKSLNGEVVKLSDFKDKYIVIDFWGSWCYWCMKGVPQMKEYYQKYKDKIEFIGIACRDKDEAWRAAIEKNQMNWVQLYNLTDVDASVLFGVSGYPTKFILDKDHKILFKVIGEDPVFYQKIDELMKGI